jgi:hypothetical protein
MFARGPLLVAQQGEESDFPRWLEDLGLADFLRRYPLRQLIEWGWVVPQHRVVFPEQFFTSWHDFPYSGDGSAPEFRAWSLLWDSTWGIDDEDEPLWFLHPFFRPGDDAGRILFEETAALRNPPPQDMTHPNGRTVVPYADYFYHWQGYALIDVIRFADCIEPLLVTPDIQKRAAGMLRLAELAKQHDPRDVLTIEKRWGGLANPMTWLSHYRTFREALWWYESQHDGDRSLRRTGARQLATHLGISAETLSTAIKDRFLVLAQDWLGANKGGRAWTVHAWPHLQRDIAAAVDWLCHLTGKTFDDFLEEWRYRDYFGHRPWAELHSVLPYEFFSDRRHFLDDVPHYLKSYNKLVPDPERLQGERLAKLVDRLRSTNYPFNSFLGAFRQLHEELRYRLDLKGQIDFRELRPLDYYSLLAIRAEGSFRYALDKENPLDQVEPENHTLREYISRLALKRGISQRTVDYFRAKDKEHTNLKRTPQDPIGVIMGLMPGFGPRDDFLARAFLCCSLARNYFAHHHYLDTELLRSEKSAFLLTGILVTVLRLL